MKESLCQGRNAVAITAKFSVSSVSLDFSPPNSLGQKFTRVSKYTFSCLLLSLIGLLKDCFLGQEIRKINGLWHTK